MKAKRTGPRYWTPADPRGIVDSRRGHRLSFDEIARLLNAGERAKAELARVKALRRCLEDGHTVQGGGGNDKSWRCWECGEDLRP